MTSTPQAAQAPAPAAPPAPPEEPEALEDGADPDALPPPPPLLAPLVVQPLVLPRSAAPEPAKGAKVQRGLTAYQRTAFRVFGTIYVKRAANPRLAEALAKARSGVRPEALQSAALLTGLIGGLSAAMMAVVFAGLLLPALGVALPLPVLFLVGLTPLITGMAGYAAVIASPGARAKARAREIDQRLPYALNYIAAMASAGVNVDTIFKSLGEQRIYGEVARESEAIYRDIALFGKDAVTAFKRAIARTPSARLAELLQGAITTFGSGGDLQAYFSTKAQRYMAENRQMQKQYLETMGLMAETYVTTAVAGPLFLIVMMAIMGMLSGGGVGQMALVIYLMLPVANFGFVYGLQAMTPEV